MPDTSRKIPTLDIKLSGAATYPEWVVSMEAYLDLIPVRDTDYRVWDIVMGTYLRPSEASDKTNTAEATQANKAIREWKDANGVALLTIRKNCEDEVRARIGNLTLAKEAYNELKKAYEVKTAQNSTHSSIALPLSTMTAKALSKNILQPTKGHGICLLESCQGQTSSQMMDLEKVSKNSPRVIKQRRNSY
jgi:hypothetical protein